MIYASVEMEMMFSNFLAISVTGFRTKIVANRNIMKSGLYSSNGVI
jgi:hypothetical protein